MVLASRRAVEDDGQQFHPAAAMGACREIVPDRSAHELGPLSSLVTWLTDRPQASRRRSGIGSKLSHRC